MFNFKLEGTFTSRPMLTMNGQEVPYKSLYASYYPMEGELPEDICLAFSVESQIGPLQANTMYRIKANADGKLTFIVADDEVRAKKMKMECKECGKVECDCMEEDAK